MSKNIKILKERIMPVLKEHGISYCALFGSFARGEEKDNSDIDLLVDFNTTISLFDFAGIKLDLEHLLGREVDLVMKKNIKPLLRPRIEKNLITLYEER